MNRPAVACGFWLATPPPTGRSAIAVIELRGDVDAGLRALDVRAVAMHDARVRDMAGLDRVLVARWSAQAASIMGHAGPVVVRELLAFMASRGLVAGAPGAATVRDAYPEAQSEIEARMLEALSRAASPLAVDVLLAQPGRWGGRRLSDHDGHGTAASAGEAPAHLLNRLIDPPLVAALGRPNIGKSTLLNALAGRAVSLVHDAPGTTRDYVGCLVNLNGLVVRWLDAPGLSDDERDPIQRRAQRHAREAASAADLTLLCCDHEHEPVRLDTGDAGVLHVGLRADLGEARGPSDVRVCATSGQGLADLAAMVRERLVPRAALDDPRPWRWW